MNDIATTCPKCGLLVDSNNPNSFNEVANFKNSKEISFNIETNSSKPKPDNDSKIVIFIIVGVVLLLVGLVVAFYFIFNKENNNGSEQSPTIELTTPDENPEEPSIDYPTTPENPETEPPESSIPENTYAYTYGIYTFYIPNNYKTTAYQDNNKEIGITLLDENTGASISFMPGVSTLKGYQEQEESLTTSMEAEGTIVNKIETKNIQNHEIYLLELIEEKLSYIMAITPIESKDNTMIIFVSDYSNSSSFNYDILNDAISILNFLKITETITNYWLTFLNIIYLY